MKKILEVSLMFVAWFAVIAQYYLMLDNQTTSIGETTIRFFSFFTILTNGLIAFYFTNLTFRTDKHKDSFWGRKGVLTALTLYVTALGLIYQVLLRELWDAHGFQLLVDELLHSAIPLGVLVYWYVTERKSMVQWKAMFRWFIYPLLYFCFILIRGSFSGFYPYPFIDVAKLGLEKVLINAAFLFFFFFVMTIFYIGLGKLYSLKKRFFPRK